MTGSKQHDYLQCVHVRTTPVSVADQAVADADQDTREGRTLSKRARRPNVRVSGPEWSE
jgi:hypothetical protein